MTNLDSRRLILVAWASCLWLAVLGKRRQYSADISKSAAFFSREFPSPGNRARSTAQHGRDAHATQAHLDIPLNRRKDDRVRRIVAIALVLSFAALGSGALERLHNAHHAIEDLKALLAARSSGQPNPKLPAHDESNCPVHVQLHLPALPVAITPPAMMLQRIARDDSQAPVVRVLSRLKDRIDCRGPPVC